MRSFALALAAIYQREDAALTGYFYLRVILGHNSFYLGHLGMTFCHK